MLYQKLNRFLEVDEIVTLFNLINCRMEQFGELLNWINKLSEEIVEY